MQIDLTIKNYRCFPDSNPARISLRKGFTALVGPNNSGKSALLRFFFEFRELFQKLADPQNELTNALRGIRRGFQLRGASDTAEIFAIENDRDLVLDLTLSTGPGEGTKVEADGITRLTINVPHGRSEFVVSQIANAGGPIGPTSALNTTQGETEWFLIRPNGQRAACLTSLMSAMKLLANTIYLGSFRNAINLGESDAYYDIPIGEAFLRRWRQFKSGASIKDAAAAHRVTGEIRRIFEFDQLELNTSDDGKTLRLIADDQPLRLEEVGSGLAQFVLVLAGLAMRPQGRASYVLLDEPELNLHPSLQVDFLTTVHSYAVEGVIFGTHSIGLARAVSQRIYALRRIRRGSTVMRVFEGTPRLAEFLGEMSFSGYRELGFQKVLLVEGPTDITTMQQFLRQRRLDHRIVVLPLGGSAMINEGRAAELTEIRRITNEIEVVIDSERESEGAALATDRQAFIEACETLGIRSHVLERRAIENYFTERAVRAVKGDAYRALEPFERLRDIKPAWGKQENWRIAREMTPDELAGTDLGDFIRSL